MSKKSNSLLREAIADAKQVRDTALANARLALEEAFTPHLSSMLATKLRNEEDDEAEEDLDEVEANTPAADGHGSDEGGETDLQAIEKSTFNENKRARRLREAKRLRKLAERYEDEDVDVDEAAEVKSDSSGYKSSDIGTASPDHSYGTSDVKDPAASTRQTAGSVDANKGQETMGEADEPELDIDPDADGDVDVAGDMGDMDGDAGALAGADAAEVPGEDVPDEEVPEEEGRDMDLESIIRELEADIEDDDTAEEPVAGMDGMSEDDVAPEMDTDDRQELDPEDDMPTEGSAGTQQTDAVADGHGSDEGGETDTNATVDSTFKESKNTRLRKENGEEDVDLEEILREIEDEEDADKADSAVANLTAELKEYRTAVKFLRSKLNEVNLLNAKLLYTNRLFRDYNMDVRSKMRVVENFDRATTVREAKLVYATIAESFRGKGSVSRKVRTSITEGMASKKSGSTASRRAVEERVADDNTPTILREGTDLAARFQKLAGIKTK